MPQWSTQSSLTSVIAAVIMSAILVGGVVTPVRAQITDNWVYRLTFFDSDGTAVQLIPSSTFDLSSVPKEGDTLTIATPFGFYDSFAVGQKFPSARLELVDGNTGETMKAYQLSQIKILAMRLSGSPTEVDVTIAMSVKTAIPLPPQ